VQIFDQREQRTDETLTKCLAPDGGRQLRLDQAHLRVKPGFDPVGERVRVTRRAPAIAEDLQPRLRSPLL
jgi:hypothetical protein